ncbi:protein EVI2A [Macrotis lagotis]|uniref:protein EVI2A n=1 Tax=Macrotis lagotis TaxID=92651 RepID=UPI003D6843A0
MEPTGCSLSAALLATTIFSWLPQTKANTTSLWILNRTDWDQVLENQTNWRGNGGSMNTETSVVHTARGPETGTPWPAFASSAPPSGHGLHTPSPPGDGGMPTTQNTEHTSKNQNEIFKKDICEESHNKMAMLVCLVIIAVLFLICTLLFLSTVILANRVSSLKRSKQVCKRQTRSNGDFLASSVLWPADSDPGKRAEQLMEARLMLQAAGTLTLPRERKDARDTEKLTL